jgi:hypothetical protein
MHLLPVARVMHSIVQYMNAVYYRKTHQPRRWVTWCSLVASGRCTRFPQTAGANLETTGEISVSGMSRQISFGH